jgi:tRNA U34 5-methylaminomethyl-2-thiouridine-forming methyltransferase MnmC
VSIKLNESVDSLRLSDCFDLESTLLAVDAVEDVRFERRKAATVETGATSLAAISFFVSTLAPKELLLFAFVRDLDVLLDLLRDLLALVTFSTETALFYN